MLSFIAMMMTTSAAAAAVSPVRSLLVGFGARRCRKLVDVELINNGSNNAKRRLSREPACSSVSGRYTYHHRLRSAAVSPVAVGAAPAPASSRTGDGAQVQMKCASFFVAGNSENDDKDVLGSNGFPATKSADGIPLHVVGPRDAQYSHAGSIQQKSSWTCVAGTPPHLLNGGTGGLPLGLVRSGGSNSCLQPLITPLHLGATLSGTCHCHSPQRARHMSTWTDILPSVPEFAQHWTVWGGSGIILKTIHHDGAVPYWACMAITNILVRSSLIPLVIQSAHTSSRFAKVAPEVQFLLTIFQRDMKGLRERSESPVTQFLVMKATWQTLSALYKVHKIHPFAVFRSPLMQLPVFWYFSIDLRKIINGADPGLAQSLTEGGLLWVTDLTEPDPWYGLPILGGLLLYANVEVALGKNILSGEATSKANVAVTLKDFFQSECLSQAGLCSWVFSDSLISSCELTSGCYPLFSLSSTGLAVFMPCFMAHQPAGVQIYLATSFVFTMLQSAALRNDNIRAIIGLPKKDAQPKEGAVTKEFVGIKKFEEKAREARGEGELLGEHGVLQPGWEITVPGTFRPSTIAGSAERSGKTLRSDKARDGPSSSDPARLRKFVSPTLEVSDDSIAVTSGGRNKSGHGVLMNKGSSVVDGISLVAREPLPQKSNHRADDEEYMPFVYESDIEAANRGELPKEPVTFANTDNRSDKNSNLRLATKKSRKRKGRK